MTALRTVRGRLRLGLRDPLLRNGYALVLNAGLTSGLGVAFWVVAARLYDVEDVGRGSALVSALMLLSVLGQLNMAAGLVRFLPTAGNRTARLLGGAYGVAGVASVLLAAAFLYVAPRVTEEFGESLPATPLLVIAFCGAVVVWTVFALQDAAITGLRRATWIPLENGVYGLLKLLLLVPLAALVPGTGVFLAWVLGAAVLLPAVNWALFRRWIPVHAARARPAGEPVHRLWDLRRFLAVDYLGSVCYLASTSALPLLVVAMLGETANGLFYVAWTISSSLDLLSTNLAQSLTVESSLAPDRMSAHLRKLLPRMAALQLASTAVIVVGAPLLLTLYGGDYSADATTVVRLLTLAVLPRAVNIVSIAIARVERRVGRVLAIQVSSAVGVLGLAVLLGPRWGIDGVAAAWLMTQTVVACVLLPRLIRTARTAPAPSGLPVPGTPAPGAAAPDPVPPLPDVDPTGGRRPRA